MRTVKRVHRGPATQTEGGVRLGKIVSAKIEFNPVYGRKIGDYT